MFSRLLLLLLAAAGQGCAWAPGQHLDPSQWPTDAALEGGRVELIPITAQWVAREAENHVRPLIPAELLGYEPASYRVGANDLLFITVWDHPDLTIPSGTQQQTEANGRLIRQDGTLFYPYIGNVQAAGKTVEELRGFIAQRLAQFIESPQVDVSVLRFASQSVVVSGAVSRAGRQSINSKPLSLLEALGTAGVEPMNADFAGLTLTRDGHEYPLDLDSLNQPQSQLHRVYLKDGDQLYLPYNDRKRIYLMGEVNQPRALSFKTRSINLVDALGIVGGLNQNTADGNAVYVIRGAAHPLTEPTRVYQLKARSPDAMALASQFDLKPQDIVYVGAAGVTRWNRLMRQLLPSAEVIGVSASTANNLGDTGDR